MAKPIGESSSINCFVEEEECKDCGRLFEPISHTGSGRRPRRLSRRITRTSTSGSLHRVCSLSGGYSYHAVDNDELEESATEEDEATGPEKELVVKWDGPGDPGDPRNMNRARKWLIVLVMSCGSACVYGISLFQLFISGSPFFVHSVLIWFARTCTSSIYTTTYGQITTEFNCSQLVATLGLSLFILGLRTSFLISHTNQPISLTDLVAPQRYRSTFSGSPVRG